MPFDLNWGERGGGISQLRHSYKWYLTILFSHTQIRQSHPHTSVTPTHISHTHTHQSHPRTSVTPTHIHISHTHAHQSRPRTSVTPTHISHTHAHQSRPRTSVTHIHISHAHTHQSHPRTSVTPMHISHTHAHQSRPCTLVTPTHISHAHAHQSHPCTDTCCSYSQMRSRTAQLKKGELLPSVRHGTSRGTDQPAHLPGWLQRLHWTLRAFSHCSYQCKQAKGPEDSDDTEHQSHH